MKRRNPLKIAATALLGSLALSSPSALRAQEASSAGVGAPRSSNERVVTEGAVPKTANSVARDAAEGRLAPVPPLVAPRVGGAIDPAAQVPVPAGAERLIPGDPATRLQPAVVAPGLARPAAGVDVAMLIEHALSMAIDGSALQAIGDQGTPIDNPDDPSRRLVEHGRRELAESRALLTQAAASGRDVSAASPARRFYTAANNYVATLNALANAPSPLNPAEKARVAMVNHAVKSVLDADHILQMGRGYAGSVALDQLLGHARDMKGNGTQHVLKLAGNVPLDPNTAPNAIVLAQRGRELLDAAEQLNPVAGVPAAAVPATGPAGVIQPGADVGRLRDTRPEIIGGTQATGSPTTGTATPAEAAAAIRNSRELPNGTLVPPTPSGAPGTGVSNYGVGNNNTPPTNSSGGLPPR